ncbi:DUF6875 domain-containing protein [Streptomyces huiliensis]|uniref:DUF6875 domain-containing protein n=1 Tax=Streptomyces huiliensis TaxID=2876027 RepID=UPI001CC043D3|nr:hypothetical protein [Streptomyces huiliensis]MBZ4318931.1 hypothetical protein [Streptomyces huiliensis]
MTTTAHTDEHEPVDTPPGAAAPGLRLVEARTPAPTTVDVTAYVDAMSAHCPYLAPSVERELTHWTMYEAAGDAADVEAAVFEAGVLSAEWLRTQADRRQATLMCENIVVSGVGRELLAWPHWALKNLYTPVGVMFGKFPVGDQIADHHGRVIPEPPVSFLAVRFVVRARDPLFLSRTPDLADAVAKAEDDGRDVFEALSLSREWKDVKLWARERLPKE